MYAIKVIITYQGSIMGRVEIKGNDFLFKGEIDIPPDKSISHRAIILSSFNTEVTRITNLLISQDTRSTMDCLSKLGAQFEELDGDINVRGTGIRNYSAPQDVLYCGNSGTTARLLVGILSGQKFSSKLDGDISLRRRPMDRVKNPLEEMGATISTTSGRLPINISPASLEGMDFDLNLGSAQVKSAILFAALTASKETTFRDKKKSRDHTEIMLSSYTSNIKINNGVIHITPDPIIELSNIDVPNDPSSAAFFIVAGLINPDSELILKNLCLNPMRIKFVEILQKMGGNIKIANATGKDNEVIGDVVVKSSQLKSIQITEDSIPAIIDEIPILCLACSVAEGESIISGASELRFKESDRIKTTVTELSKLGCEIQEINDEIRITGKETLQGAPCESNDDHRIAMMIAIAGTKALGETVINNAECVSISFPNFFKLLKGFRKNIQ